MIPRTHIAAVIAMLLSACGGAPDSSGNGAGNASATAAAPIATKRAGPLDVVLDSVKIQREAGYMGLLPSAPAGATYVIAHYTLKNTTAGPVPMEDWPVPSLVDPADHSLDAETVSSTAISALEHPDWYATINPHLSTSVTKVWKVDEQSFDRANWHIAFSGKPPLKFPLQ